jgi:hypothetical protein
MNAGRPSQWDRNYCYTGSKTHWEYLQNTPGISPKHTRLGISPNHPFQQSYIYHLTLSGSPANWTDFFELDADTGMVCQMQQVNRSITKPGKFPGFHNFTLTIQVSHSSSLIFSLSKYMYLQRGPKVTPLVARSSRRRCAQHLHDVRGLHGAHRTQILRVTFA